VPRPKGHGSSGGSRAAVSPQRFALRAPRPRFHDALNRRVGIVPSVGANRGGSWASATRTRKIVTGGTCELRHWPITLAMQRWGPSPSTVGVVPPLFLASRPKRGRVVDGTTARGSNLRTGIRTSLCDGGDLRSSPRARPAGVQPPGRTAGLDPLTSEFDVLEL
jgi:hypothetical protein